MQNVFFFFLLHFLNAVGQHVVIWAVSYLGSYKTCLGLYGLSNCS